MSLLAWSVATFAAGMAGTPLVQTHHFSPADGMIRSLSTQAADRRSFIESYQYAARLLP